MYSYRETLHFSISPRILIWLELWRHYSTKRTHTQQDSHIISTCLAIQTTEKQCTSLDLTVIEGHLRCVMLLLGEPEEQVGPSVGPSVGPAPRIPFLSSLVRIK